MQKPPRGRRRRVPPVFSIEGVMDNLPAYIWVLKGVAAPAMPAMLGIALYRGARASGVSRRAALLVGTGAFGVLIAWVIAAAVLAGMGAFRFSTTAAVPLLAVVSLGVVVALLV